MKATKLPSGAWRAQAYDYTDEKGRKHYRSFTAPSKKEAEYMASQFYMNKETERDNNSATLNQAMTNYCNLKSNVLSPSTLREYRRMQQNYFNSLLEISLKDITPRKVQQWANEFSVNHSPKTVRNAHGLLSTVLDTYAPGIQLHTTLPQKVLTYTYVPSDGDIKALLDYFSTNDKDMEIAVYLAAFGTLRRSEICALTADDIKGNVVSVSRAMVDKGNSEWVIKTTKTVSSTRLVEMPSFVISKCPKNGRIVNLHPDNITHRFATALKKLDINSFRFHDLRHYAASIMHAIGVPDQYIMQRGGWSSDKTLKAIYRGIIKDYTEKYTDMTLAHFEEISHGISHEIKKPQ